MKNLIQRFIHEEEGQDLVEYAFLLLFIALAVTALVQATGNSVNTIWTRIRDEIGAVD